MALRVLSVVLPVLLIITVAVNSARRGTWTARSDGTGRILDGKPAKVGQFPHQARIHGENVDTGADGYFDGTLISRRAVLTFASGITRYNKWTIRLGGIKQTGHEDTAWTTDTPWALPHPDYNSETEYADLAIIYLLVEAPLNDYIKPVELPSSLEANTEYLLKDCVISGFGSTSPDAAQGAEVLQWTEVTVVPNGICKPFYPSVDMRDKLCAGNENVAALRGDVGTGLHLRDADGFKQIGIFVEFRSKNRTRPGVYIKVASYIDWIKLKAPTNN